MEPLTVKTHEGKIWIEQQDIGDGVPTVVIDPAQVPVLIEWLKEAAAELLGS